MKRNLRRLALRRLRLLRRLSQFDRPGTVDDGIVMQQVTDDSPVWSLTTAVKAAMLPQATRDRIEKKVRG